MKYKYSPMRMLKIKEIVKRNDNIDKAVKEMVLEGLIITHSSGRRLFHLLKDYC